MKIPRRTVEDLLVLIDHTRTDLSYGAGGSYVSMEDQEKVEKGEVRSAERAIEFIKQLIIQP